MTTTFEKHEVIYCISDFLDNSTIKARKGNHYSVYETHPSSFVFRGEENNLCLVNYKDNVWFEKMQFYTNEEVEKSKKEHHNQPLLDVFLIIEEKDPAFAAEIKNMVGYLASTYQDKYQCSEVRNEGIIYSPRNGKGFNIGNAVKYLSRYLTTGFEKSENPKDLQKAIHYCLFELTRKSYYNA